jgi:hypothetical protein
MPIVRIPRRQMARQGEAGPWSNPLTVPGVAIAPVFVARLAA